MGECRDELQVAAIDLLGQLVAVKEILVLMVASEVEYCAAQHLAFVIMEVRPILHERLTSQDRSGLPLLRHFRAGARARSMGTLNGASPVPAAIITMGCDESGSLNKEFFTKIGTLSPTSPRLHR